MAKVDAVTVGHHDKADIKTEMDETERRFNAQMQNVFGMRIKNGREFYINPVNVEPIGALPSKEQIKKLIDVSLEMMRAKQAVLTKNNFGAEAANLDVARMTDLPVIITDLSRAAELLSDDSVRVTDTALLTVSDFLVAEAKATVEIISPMYISRKDGYRSDRSKWDTQHGALNAATLQHINLVEDYIKDNLPKWIAENKLNLAASPVKPRT